jgi:hypothetical protein
MDRQPAWSYLITMKKLLLLPLSLLIMLSTASAANKVYKGHCKGWGKAMLMSKHKSRARYH